MEMGAVPDYIYIDNASMAMAQGATFPPAGNHNTLTLPCKVRRLPFALSTNWYMVPTLNWVKFWRCPCSATRLIESTYDGNCRKIANEEINWT
jgi:hypothetical protein